MYAAAGLPLVAVKALHHGLAENPEPEHCWRMGRLYAEALRVDAAVQWMDRALARKDNPEWRLEKARLLYAHERYAQSRKAAVQAAKTDFQQQGQAWLLAGYAAWQEQDWIGAKNAFARAERIEETASRAASCLQTVERILESAHKIRLAGAQRGLPSMDTDVADNVNAGSKADLGQRS